MKKSWNMRIWALVKKARSNGSNIYGGRCPSTNQAATIPILEKFGVSKNIFIENEKLYIKARPKVELKIPKHF